MLQWLNFIELAVANVLVVNLGGTIYFLAKLLANLLYFFPGLATTPSNKIDPQDPTNKGIPYKTIYNSVKRIQQDPNNPLIIVYECYILLLDILHSLAYLLEYVQEYLTFEQEAFPTVIYSGRSGTDLSNDLFQLSNKIGVWQFWG